MVIRPMLLPTVSSPNSISPHKVLVLKKYALKYFGLMPRFLKFKLRSFIKITAYVCLYLCMCVERDGRGKEETEHGIGNMAKYYSSYTLANIS